MKKSKTKLPIKTYLFYLILVAVLITGTSFARYTVSVDGGDSIGVAKPILTWDLEDGAQNPITLTFGDIKPGDSINYQLSVTNSNASVTSDVAIDFYITITITNNLPLDITLTEDITGGKVYSQDIVTHTITTDSYIFNIVTAQIIEFVLNVDWDSANNSGNYNGLSDTITINVVWGQRTQPMPIP